MALQEEAPLPIDPLATAAGDYRDAVLHLAWDLDRSKVRTLVFAFVELLPTEVPPPPTTYDPKAPAFSHRLGGSSVHRVYVRRVVVPLRAALAWYAACRRGSAALPDSGGDLPDPEAIPPELCLRTPAYDETPVWPALSSNAENCDALPFLPSWIHCPRTHHLLPVTPFGLGALWSVDEGERARVWLRGRLHFSLADYPHYWGSVHLVAPNPVYRSLHTRRQPRTGGAESVLVRVATRAGCVGSTPQLRIRESTQAGITTSRDVAVRGPVVRLNFTREVHGVAIDVYDPLRGFLNVSTDTHVFLRSIRADIGLSRTVVVHAGGETFEVKKGSATQQIVTGAPSPGTAWSQLAAARIKRAAKRDGDSHDHIWFDDQRAEARELLRGLIGRARHEVLFVDPYFAAPELAFAIAVGREEIPIRILSSAATFTEKASDGMHENGDVFAAELARLRATRPMNPVHVRVMRGKKPAVHDRFLVVDERIWALGSSLNEFGSRGTMLIRLPYPEAITPYLERAWRDAEPFDDWLRAREREKARTQPGARAGSLWRRALGALRRRIGR